MANNDFQIPKFGEPFDIGRQKAESLAYLERYGAEIAGLPSPAGILTGFEERFGVPGLRGRVAQLGELGEGLYAQVRGAPKQIAGTTRESLVTEAQRAGLVQERQRPLYESLAEVTRGLAVAGPALSQAEQRALTMAGMETEQARMALLPFERGFDLMETRFAREQSNYQFSETQELNRLIANQSAGITLSEGEKDRLATLAGKEMEYKNQLDQLRVEAEEKRRTGMYLGETLEGTWEWG